jgi:hypothetical protein
MWATSVIFLMPRVNNRPLGKKSLNLVTLIPAKDLMSVAFVGRPSKAIHFFRRNQKPTNSDRSIFSYKLFS